jgi:hypothetical protein
MTGLQGEQGAATSQCQPIASLASRRRAYWREVRQVVPMLAFMHCLAAGLCYAAVRLLGAPWLNAAVVAAVIMAGPVWMLWPGYPGAEDIERDQALRRAAGCRMTSSVTDTN